MRHGRCCPRYDEPSVVQSERRALGPLGAQLRRSEEIVSSTARTEGKPETFSRPSQQPVALMQMQLLYVFALRQESRCRNKSNAPARLKCDKQQCRDCDLVHGEQR